MTSKKHRPRKGGLEGYERRALKARIEILDTMDNILQLSSRLLAILRGNSMLIAKKLELKKAKASASDATLVPSS